MTSSDGRVPPPPNGGHRPGGGSGGRYGHGNHHHSYRPTYNHFYYGPSGFGWGYYGGGFGISIGLPLTRYYDYYDVAQPYYVDPYPQPYYAEYVQPEVVVVEGAVVDPVEYGEPVLNAPEPAMAEAINGPSIIPAAGNAGEFQAEAEQAFREHRYEDAARLSNHAIIEDRGNGKLHLFASQVFFALGDYRSSAASIQLAASMLDSNQWGYVVENFKQFYRGEDYVSQMAALMDFIRANPNESYAHFLRGYHYKYLGYDKEARSPLLKAVEMEGRDRLAAELLVMAGGTLPQGVTPGNVDANADTDEADTDSDVPVPPPSENDDPAGPANDGSKIVGPDAPSTDRSTDVEPGSPTKAKTDKPPAAKSDAPPTPVEDRT